MLRRKRQLPIDFVSLSFFVAIRKMPPQKFPQSSCHLFLFTPVKFSSLVRPSASLPVSSLISVLCFLFFISFSSCMSATFHGPQSASRPHPSPPPECCLVALTACGLRARRHFWLLCRWHAALRPLGEILVRGRAAPDPLAAKISRFVEASSGSGRVGCRAGRWGGREVADR